MVNDMEVNEPKEDKKGTTAPNTEAMKTEATTNENENSSIKVEDATMDDAKNESKEECSKVTASDSTSTNKPDETPSNNEEKKDKDDETMKTEDDLKTDPDEGEELENLASFVLRPPVTTQEVSKVEQKVQSTIGTAIQILDSQGAKPLLDSETVIFHPQMLDVDDEKTAEEDDRQTKALEEAVIRGNPRKYQLALFEKAKKKNTIVNLGTGQGKTLITLLCISHFSSPAYEEGKQTLFLVPSIALAVQHSTTLRANLPFKVATACHSTSNSEQAKKELEQANIIVATHGAALDLFRHYGDIISLERTNLIVLDECHYATGNHGYARIMKMFYHRLPKHKRPRILGLTASPLVNVRPTVKPEQLQKMLHNLEIMLDAELACFSSTAEDLGMEVKEAEERVVQFNNEPPEFPLPTHEEVGLHASRIKELNQLVGLYADFGPRVTGTYCRTLTNEISINRFEKETPVEFERMRERLATIAQFCEDICAKDEGKDGGRSDKLIVLESLLMQIMNSDDGTDIVGVIFVERRITALALHGYLRNKWREMEQARQDDNDPRPVFKCDMIVRQSTQVFKYLHPSHRYSVNDIKNVNEEWLHKTKKVRDVLDGLRRKETNVLIATSVVEEGVDVDACSFVIVLDHIKTSKGYVQMKGRARRKNAKFFVFENVHPDSSSPCLTLRAAQDVERRVKMFIELRESNIPEALSASLPKPYRGLSASFEEKALHEGEYRAAYGYVDLQSAKSLLNRYSLSIPMEITSRASRQAMLLHMPIYDGSRLTLPAHLPSDVRSVVLPTSFHDANKKDLQNMLALMACVRLHKLNLLSDRLLPLRRRDMHQRLLSVALAQLPSVTKPLVHEPPPVEEGESKTAHVYKFDQQGEMLSQHEAVLNTRNRRLGLLTLEPLVPVPPWEYEHNELGAVKCTIQSLPSISLTEKEWDLCCKFYTATLDFRWRRRTGQFRFRYNSQKVKDGILPPYVVISLKDDNQIDWERMQRVADEYSRTEEQNREGMKETMENLDTEPRLWRPMYDPNVIYIALGKSGVFSSSPFPYNSDYASYSEYFSKRYGYKVPPTSNLIAVQRLWTLPRRMRSITAAELSLLTPKQLKKRKVEEIIDEFSSKGDQLKEGERASLKGLGAALLPMEVCSEAPVADAALFLQSLLVPQMLYHIDRILTVHAFMKHCLYNIPSLNHYLEKIPIEYVLEALTARSCSMNLSYDRLEYLGDAVLKLIHTDALLQSKDLRKWVGYLHEGDLSTLRSAMGSNERLKDAALSVNIHKFILTVPLGRGQWVPVGLEMVTTDGEEEVVTKGSATDFAPSNKVCADVIESLIGLVYIYFGYKPSIKVAEQLGISLPVDDEDENETQRKAIVPKVQIKSFLLDLVKSVLGSKDFHNTDLIVEALTHPSCIHEEVPCYQKLEWVGDAVLCLAARNWVYHKYPNLRVAELVVIETTLVCNETLAYLSVSKGVQRFINHRDPSLPHRFEEFEYSMGPMGRGLWGTDPPKVLPDVVEALIGSAHVDSGYEAGQNAALFVLKPVIGAVEKQMQGSSDYLELKGKAKEMMHPKQLVHEIAGRFLQARSMREDEFANRHPDCPIWKGYYWGEPNPESSGAVGQVLCCGLNVIAVGEASAHIAKNRACGLAVAFFNRAPDLLENVQKISLALNKVSSSSSFTAAAAAKEKDDEN